jgi:hypothetical protein
VTSVQCFTLYLAPCTGISLDSDSWLLGFKSAIPARHRERSGEAGGRNPKSSLSALCPMPFFARRSLELKDYLLQKMKKPPGTKIPDNFLF